MAYALQEGKWGGSTLGTSGGTVTYAFATASTDARYGYDSSLSWEYQAAIHAAFGEWASYGNISFTYTTNTADADILLGWDAMDGKSGSIAEATTWTSNDSIVQAEIRFDPAESWVATNEQASGRNISFEAVAMHEIGHALGIDHYDGETAIMNTYYGATLELTGSDIQAVTALYGPAAQSALQIAGGFGDDSIHGGTGADKLDGGDGDDRLYGKENNDELRGGLGHDFQDGHDGDDRIWGFWGNDTLLGGNGDDELYGEGDSDAIWGWYGDDLILGGAGADRLFGEQEDDVVIGGSENDQLGGNDGNDRLYGEGGDDTLWGDAGNDQLGGNDGNDQLYGFAGNDTLWGDAGKDALRGGSGDDRLFGFADNDFIDGEDGNDFLRGGDGADTVYGGAGADDLAGEAGADFIWGLTGNDVLNGGAGNDILGGEAGNDTFVFSANSGVDRIIGFEGGSGAGDVIRILAQPAFDTFAEVWNASSVVNDTLQMNLSGTTVILEGYSDMAELTQDDFAFA